MEVDLSCGCENCFWCRKNEERRISCLSDTDFILEFGKKIWLQYKADGKNLNKAYLNINEWNQWFNKLKESYELEGQ